MRLNIIQSFLKSRFSLLSKLFDGGSWQQFKTPLSPAEANDMIQRLKQVEDRFDFSRNLAIDVLKLYLQTVIAVVIIPIIFQDKLLPIFGDAVKYIYWSWLFIFVSISLGFLSYFFIFEGYYHLARFYHYVLFTPYYADEKVRVRAQKERAVNQFKSFIFLEAAHWLGIATITLFCFAIGAIIIAILPLIK
jgi:hypothetical protein